MGGLGLLSLFSPRRSRGVVGWFAIYLLKTFALFGLLGHFGFEEFRVPSMGIFMRFDMLR
jgi:hypothetical protein